MNRLSLSTLLLLSAIVSCGKAPEPDKASDAQFEAVQADGANINGFYEARIFSLNHNLQLGTLGKLALERQDDTFTAKVRIPVSDPGVWHRQDIYEGTRCPDMSDDLNKDNVIDLQEARRAVGKILLPLDGNIGSQIEGRNQYPRGSDTNGSYFYEKTTSFQKFYGDLTSVDENPNDQFTRISEEAGLTFVGKVVLIQGATESMVLPGTVASDGGLGAHASLPVGCGYIMRVAELSPELRGDNGRDPQMEERTPRDVPAPVPAPTPTPDTWPTPTPTPSPDMPAPAPTPEGEDDGDDWTTDIRDWWRRRFPGGETR